ncbi:MAG: hydrogenase nickel incorporation protein HypB [Anaerolineae bacterium]
MVVEIPVVRNILSANERRAADNRALLARHRVCAVNIMASPGAGKTSLILRTAEVLRGIVRVGVVEGDVASRVDADKVAAAGIPVVQINTGGACHLEAPMVGAALEQLPLETLDLVFIENIGNLICPVDFQLGEHARVLVSSIPEGDDKGHKYPGIFAAVDAVVLNKLDLAPYVPFDRDAFRRLLQGLNPKAPLFELSCTTGEGLQPWAAWLQTLAAHARGPS